MRHSFSLFVPFFSAFFVLEKISLEEVLSSNSGRGWGLFCGVTDGVAVWRSEMPDQVSATPNKSFNHEVQGLVDI